MKARLGTALETQLERLLQKFSITALADRWHVAPQTLDGVRFGGTAMPSTIEKLRRLIEDESGKAA